MPFESERQRRWMHANEPEMAKRWEHEMGNHGYKRGENNDDAETYYPSSGVHPSFSAEEQGDYRATCDPSMDFKVHTMIDNGACFDVEDGELGYKIARDYGATGFGVGGASGGSP